MAHPNFVEKSFVGGSKTAKFVKVFSLESFPLYSIIRVVILFVMYMYYTKTELASEITCNLYRARFRARLLKRGGRGGGRRASVH